MSDRTHAADAERPALDMVLDSQPKFDRETARWVGIVSLVLAGHGVVLLLPSPWSAPPVPPPSPPSPLRLALSAPRPVVMPRAAASRTSAAPPAFARTSSRLRPRAPAPAPPPSAPTQPSTPSLPVPAASGAVRLPLPQAPAVEASAEPPKAAPFEGSKDPSRQSASMGRAATPSAAANSGASSEGGEVPVSGPSRPARPWPSNAPAAYTSAARMAREEGVVLLALLVDAEGRVQSVRLRVSSGYPRLDQIAQDTVRTWRFEPALQAGQKVESQLLQPIRFTLRDEDD